MHEPTLDLDMACGGCRKGVDAISYYMVHDDLWETHGNGEGFLCLDCLSVRMGRRVVQADLTDAPINHPDRKHDEPTHPLHWLNRGVSAPACAGKGEA